MEQKTFPFGIPFQRAIIRHLVEDQSFRHRASELLESTYFTDEVLAWMFESIKWLHTTARPVTPLVIEDLVRHLPVENQARYMGVVEAVVHGPPVREDAYLKEQVLDFVRRNVFVRTFAECQTLYNNGQADAAYDHLMRGSDKITQITFDPPDRAWFFEELQERQRDRLAYALNESSYTFATGIPELDKVLDGGLSRGEIGAWVAYSKIGKSTLLADLGQYAVRALRIKVLEIIWEGQRSSIENKYDAMFANETLSLVRRGLLDHGTYNRMMSEFRHLRQLLVIRSFSGRYDTTVLDVRAELDELRGLGFVPDLLICDYWDYVMPRNPRRYSTKFELQQASWRDATALVAQDNGYAMWTASQAVRPDKGADEREHIVKARDISECWAKVQLASFVGSINRTIEEKKMGMARLYADIYRENDAHKLIQVRTAYDRGGFVDRTVPPPEAVVGAHTTHSEQGGE